MSASFESLQWKHATTPPGWFEPASALLRRELVDVEFRKIIEDVSALEEYAPLTPEIQGIWCNEYQRVLLQQMNETLSEIPDSYAPKRRVADFLRQCSEPDADANTMQQGAHDILREMLREMLFRFDDYQEAPTPLREAKIISSRIKLELICAVEMAVAALEHNPQSLADCLWFSMVCLRLRNGDVPAALRQHINALIALHKRLTHKPMSDKSRQSGQGNGTQDQERQNEDGGTDHELPVPNVNLA